MIIGYTPFYYIRDTKTNTLLKDPKNPRFDLHFKSTYNPETGKTTYGNTLVKRYLASLPNKENLVIEKVMMPIE